MQFGNFIQDDQGLQVKDVVHYDNHRLFRFLNVIHAPRDIMPEWIGQNVRLALQTSESFTPIDGGSVDGDALIAMKAASNERRLAFWDDITASYGYKSRDVAWKKFDLVAAAWRFELTKDIELLSTKSSRSGAHSA